MSLLQAAGGSLRQVPRQPEPGDDADSEHQESTGAEGDVEAGEEGLPRLCHGLGREARFDARQTALIDAAIADREPTLEGTALVIASVYVECVLAQGREISGVLAALAGSPELEAVKRDYQLAFIEKCRQTLADFVGPEGIAQSALWAMLGAGDALAHAAVTGEVTAEEAKDELYAVILAMVERSHR